MRSRVASVLAAIFLFQSNCLAAPAQTSVQRWTSANLQAIVRIRDRKKRSNAQRAFAGTLALLGRERASRDTVNPAHDPEQLARSILANHRIYRFAQPQAAPPKTWWERVMDWLAQRWSRIEQSLFGRVRMPGRMNVGIADILLALCILVFLAMLGRVVWLYARPARSESSGARAIAQRTDPAILLAKSLQAAQRGAYPIAIAQLFSAALGLLTVRRGFEERPAETVGEMRWRMRARNPQLMEPFENLAIELTRAIYAEHRLDANDWTRSIAAYRRLESLLSDGPA